MFLSLYFSKLNSPTYLSLAYIECSDHPHCHLQDSLSMTVPFLHWAAKMPNRALQKWSYKSWITLLDLLVVFLPRQPRMLLTFFAARAHRWCLFTLLPVLITRSFLFRATSQLFISQPVLLCGITLSKVQGLHLDPWPLWGSCQIITAAWAAPSESQSCPPVPWLLLLWLSATCKFVRVALCAILSHNCNNRIPCQGSFQELKELASIWWALYKEKWRIQAFSLFYHEQGSYRRAAASKAQCHSCF